MRTTIVLDGELIEKVMRYSGAKSLSEAIHVALAKYVAMHEGKPRILEFFGSDVIDPTYDYKATRR